MCKSKAGRLRHIRAKHRWQAVNAEPELALGLDLEPEDEAPQSPERLHQDLPPEPRSQQFHVQEPTDDNFDGICFN